MIRIEFIKDEKRKAVIKKLHALMQAGQNHATLNKKDFDWLLQQINPAATWVTEFVYTLDDKGIDRKCLIQKKGMNQNERLGVLTEKGTK